MNLLAHVALAQGHENWILGALLGDHIKGPLRGERGGVEQGIQLHRHIDATIDRHPLRQASLREMPRGLRRFGGIVLDIHDDYLLTHHWLQLYSIPLATLNHNACSVFASAQPALSGSAERHAQAVVKHQVLLRFAHWDAVAGSLQQVATRLRQTQLSQDAETWLVANTEQLEQRFLGYYPELQQAADVLKRGFSAEQ